MLPELNDAWASAQALFIESRPVLAPSRVALSTLAGSVLALERMSTRPWMVSSTLGSPPLMSAQLLANSAFFAAAVSARAFALAVRSGAPVRTVLYSPLAKLSLRLLRLSCRALASSGTYFDASATVAVTALSAALRAVSAGTLSLAQALRRMLANTTMVRAHQRFTMTSPPHKGWG